MEIIRARRTQLGRVEHERLQVSSQLWSGQTGLAFVFTGQGAQNVGMGKGLMQFEVLADTLQQINDIFARMGCQWSLICGFANSGIKKSCT